MYENDFKRQYLKGYKFLKNVLNITFLKFEVVNREILSFCNFELWYFNNLITIFFLI